MVEGCRPIERLIPLRLPTAIHLPFQGRMIGNDQLSQLKVTFVGRHCTCVVDGTIMLMAKRRRDRMFNRKPLAYFGIALLCLTGLVQVWVFEEGQHWPVWVWLPLLVIGLGSLWVLRDPPDPKAKAFDFNPRRGAFYFLAGFIVFPIITVINAIFGADLSIASMAGFTLIGSCLAGIAGTFTENIGI